jgi:galactokinase
MDQMASSLGSCDQMLFLDTATLEHRLVRLPAGSELVVIDSGLSRELAGSAYNVRRQECEAAARMLSVPTLRAITDVSSAAQLPAPHRQRVRHVVTENARVLAALEADAQTFGELMDASHASLRDDYAVSTPALDDLVATLRRHPDVFGARLTGAGFGGACVALVRSGTAAGVASDVVRPGRAAGGRLRSIVPALRDG